VGRDARPKRGALRRRGLPGWRCDCGVADLANLLSDVGSSRWSRFISSLGDWIFHILRLRL
jgi:hypothetical protein